MHDAPLVFRSLAFLVLMASRRAGAAAQMIDTVRSEGKVVTADERGTLAMGLLEERH